MTVQTDSASHKMVISDDAGILRTQIEHAGTRSKAHVASLVKHQSRALTQASLRNIGKSSDSRTRTARGMALVSSPLHMTPMDTSAHLCTNSSTLQSAEARRCRGTIADCLNACRESRRNCHE